MGREEMLNSLDLLKVELLQPDTQSWHVFCCHFLLEISHPSLQKEHLQNAIQLYLDSQERNNCNVIDNLKFREMILLIKS